MQQMISISDARKNLSQLVADVTRDDLSVIIIRDSVPEAVLMPYKRILENEKSQKILWTKKWDELLSIGIKQGQKWAKKKKLNLSKLTEEDLYARVEQT